jgi:hypothetical protein
MVLHEVLPKGIDCMAMNHVLNSEPSLRGHFAPCMNLDLASSEPHHLVHTSLEEVMLRLPLGFLSCGIS